MTAQCSAPQSDPVNSAFFHSTAAIIKKASSASARKYIGWSTMHSVRATPTLTSRSTVFNHRRELAPEGMQKVLIDGTPVIQRMGGNRSSN